MFFGAACWGGIEYGIASNWSLGFEYEHRFIQPRTENFSESFGGPIAPAMISMSL